MGWRRAGADWSDGGVHPGDRLGLRRGGSLGAAPPAYAEVATAQYTIGTPTNAVASVVASPATLSQTLRARLLSSSGTLRFRGRGGASTVTSSTALAGGPGQRLSGRRHRHGLLSGRHQWRAGHTTAFTIDLAASCNVPGR